MEYEGYIKYRLDWQKEEISIPGRLFDEMNHCRTQLLKNNWLGVYPNGIGFGNLSSRLADNQFLISGSATGGISQLEMADYSLVSEFSIADNSVKCKGLTAASSESLSHAALYIADKRIEKIVHIHNMALWKRWKNRLPTTSEDVSYGTPEMAHALQSCLQQIESAKGLIIMGGHPEGIIAFGNDFDEILGQLKRL